MLRNLGSVAGDEDFTAKMEDSDEKNEEEDIAALSATVVCIILLLIYLTIGFEVLEESVHKNSNTETMPIINAMFAEMTTLGFLSMCTFITSQFSFVTILSEKIFGESGKLLEIFELIHYILFFVMICFMGQVLLSAKEAMATQEKWLQMELESRDEEHMKNFVIKQKQRGVSLESLLHKTFFGHEKLKVFNRSSGRIIEEILLFHALREEFIKDRSIQTYEAAPEEKRVSKDFNFGRYLGICMGKILTDIVHVHISTWYFFATLTVIFYGIVIFSNYNTVLLSWVWVSLGYCFLIYERFHERELINIIRKFAGLEGTHILKVFKKEIEEEKKGKSNNGELNEETTLLDDFVEDSSHLPAWCRINLEEHIRNRSWIKSLVIGKVKLNPHHALFYWEHQGPKSIRMYLQVSHVFLGIYVALLLVAFFPIMKKEYNYLFYLLFIVISIFPVYTMMRNQQLLIAKAVLVSSFGTNRFLQAVATVCREEKTSHLVRTLFIVYKFHKACEGKEEKDCCYLKTKLSKSDLGKMNKTFDQFAVSGDHMTRDDIKQILSKVGLEHNENALKNIISILDTDGDGKISKDEFFDWYADILYEDCDMTNTERAKFLFKMFDKDGDESITVGEFKESLDALDLGFTVDEIGEIVQEIDEDGNGVICVKEFEDLLEKYYPKKFDIETE